MAFLSLSEIQPLGLKEGIQSADAKLKDAPAPLPGRFPADHSLNVNDLRKLLISDSTLSYTPSVESQITCRPTAA